MTQTQLQQQIGFLKESFKNLRETGSITPSSRFLCRRIAAKIDPSEAKVVVELGPGDGVITRYILDRLRPDARLIIFEINEVFVEKLQRDFEDPRLTVIHDSAEHMGRHFAALGIQKVDYFVSGIPFLMLPDSLAVSITGECRKWLRAAGRFIQFHYSPHVLGLYKRAFGNAQIDFAAWNVPPAFIIECVKV
jgi:phospholipid N-methyltransferase